MMNSRLLDIAIRIAEHSPISIDRLPYTPTFDMLAVEFRRLYTKPLTDSEIWLALLSARKRGMVSRKGR